MFETALNNPDIIESATGDGWFYIKYSNGFVLQGSHTWTTVSNPFFNFPVPMKDTNYVAATSYDWNTTGQNGVFSSCVAGRQTTGFQNLIIGRTGQTGVAFYGGLTFYIVYGEYAQ